MKSMFYASAACVLVMMSSCSDDSSDKTSTTPTTSIGKAGGTVSANDASVEIPAGALSAAIEIGVAGSDVDVAPPDGYTLAGPAIAFTPHGTTFTKPVTLTLPYTSSSKLLTVLRLDDEQDTSWEEVAGGKFSGGSATLDVSGFSIYAVATGTPDASTGGAGGMSSGGMSGSDALGGVSGGDAGGANDSGGASPAGGAGNASGDLAWSCDRADTDGQGLRICSDYFYPKMIVDLLGDQLVVGCPGPGNGVLLDACDTSNAVVGCRTNDADGIPGVTVTNWYYMGTKADIASSVLCSKAGTDILDPP